LAGRFDFKPGVFVLACSLAACIPTDILTTDLDAWPCASDSDCYVDHVCQGDEGVKVCVPAPTTQRYSFKVNVIRENGGMFTQETFPNGRMIVCVRPDGASGIGSADKTVCAGGTCAETQKIYEANTYTILAGADGYETARIEVTLDNDGSVTEDVICNETNTCTLQLALPDCQSTGGCAVPVNPNCEDIEPD